MKLELQGLFTPIFYCYFRLYLVIWEATLHPPSSLHFKMSSDKLHRLQRLISDFSVFLHTEQSSFPHDDSLPPPPDLSQVLRLDPADALVQIRSTVTDLLRFKRSVLLSREYEGIKTAQQYEGALQKLESEVRNHIKVEQQLKIHIENVHGRIEEAERDNERLKKEIRVGKDVPEDSSRKALQESQSLRHSAKRDQMKISELEKLAGRLEAEGALQRSELQEKTKECTRLTQELEKYKGLISHVKENIQSVADLRTTEYVRKPASHVEYSRDDGRSISPFGITTMSQRNLKSTAQRSNSTERLKSAMRPLTATRRVNRK